VIVSSTPGRVRVRHPALRSQSRADQARDALLAIAGVQSVAGDARVGSLLVSYDPAHTSEATVVAALQLGELPARVAEPRAWPRIPSGTAGMAVSLSVSLGAAAAKLKWLHVAAGVVFVALVGVHVFGRTQARPKHRGRQHDV
jgi:hypothetical protein